MVTEQDEGTNKHERKQSNLNRNIKSKKRQRPMMKIKHSCRHLLDKYLVLFATKHILYYIIFVTAVIIALNATVLLTQII